jgi:hypothetical protein
MGVFGDEFSHFPAWFVVRLDEPDIARMLGKDTGLGFPGMARGKGDASISRDAQRLKAGGA